MAGIARFGIVLLAFLAPPVHGTLAQDPAARAGLEAFRDSLAPIADTAALLRLERDLIDVAKVQRDSALLHLRLGFVALRLGRVSGRRSHYDDAASEFEWAAELQPRWPYPWFGLGLAEASLERPSASFGAGIRAVLGIDPLVRGAEALGRSVEADPAFVPGLVELARLTLRQRFDRRTALALTALRRAAGTPAGQVPAVLLARGRVERETGDPDSALAAFRDYLRAGGERGIGQLEEARTLFRLGRLDGAQPYFAGATSTDTAAVAAYRADLAPIASEAELAELAPLRGARRASWLRHFWFRRDRAELRRDGERLREHYRRWFFAERHYRLALTKRRYDVDEPYRSGSSELDDRGVVYLRHGEPTDQATLAGPGVCGNITWRYARDDQDLVFHFVARDDVEDFRLVESVYDVIGAGDRLRLREDNCRGGSVEDLLLSRSGIAPVYGRLLATGGASESRYRLDERIAGERSIAVGTTTDSYRHRFAQPLAARAEVQVVGREETGSLAHVVFTINGATADARRTLLGAAYPFRIRIVFTDSTGEPRAALDTTRLFLAERPLGRDELLAGRMAVVVPPGRLSWRILVQQGEDRGTLLPWDTLTAGRFDGGDLALSDLVLGDRGAHVTWRPAPGDTVWFNPLGAHPRGNPLELYYELYGAGGGAGTAVRTEITVSRRPGKKFLGLFGGGGGTAIRLAYQGEAEGPVTRVRRTVDVSRLKPGKYRVDVRVTDATGRTTTRRRELEILPSP